MTKSEVMYVNNRQQLFVTEYLKDLNATQAAIRAGYSERTARSQGQRLLTKVDIKNAITEAQTKLQEANIASALDIQEFLSRVMIGEVDEEVISTVFEGDGYSRTVKDRKEVSAKDRIKAAELLGKRYGMWVDKQELSGNIGVVKIVDDIPEADDDG